MAIRGSTPNETETDRGDAVADRLFCWRRVCRWSSLRRRRQWIQSLRNRQADPWPGGVVNYYTDQGNLSPQLPSRLCRRFRRGRVRSWTAVTTAALQINHAGQLSEDVSGSQRPECRLADSSRRHSAELDPNRSPSSTTTTAASSTPCSARAGSDADFCNTNAVIAYADNFTSDGQFAHALVIINGNCALVCSRLA